MNRWEALVACVSLLVIAAIVITSMIVGGHP